MLPGLNELTNSDILKVILGYEAWENKVFPHERHRAHIGVRKCILNFFPS